MTAEETLALLNTNNQRKQRDSAPQRNLIVPDNYRDILKAVVNWAKEQGYSSYLVNYWVWLSIDTRLTLDQRKALDEAGFIYSKRRRGYYHQIGTSYESTIIDTFITRNNGIDLADADLDTLNIASATTAC